MEGPFKYLVCGPKPSSLIDFWKLQFYPTQEPTGCPKTIHQITSRMVHSIHYILSKLNVFLLDIIYGKNKYFAKNVVQVFS